MDAARMIAFLFLMACLEVNGQNTSSLSCSISADKNSEDLEQALELGYNMLFMTISFSNDSRTIPISLNTPQPLTWIHVSGSHGKGLIWLRQNFKVLSLTSLRYGIDNLDIKLSDSPEGCLSTKPAAEIAVDVRDFILNNFAGPGTNNTSIGKEVCNAKFRDHETGTEVDFVCCKKDESFQTTCYELKRNNWMNIFFLFILVLPVFALMFAPLLIPFDLFRDNGSDIFYQHKLDPALNIHITKRRTEQDVETSKLEIPEKYFKDMPMLSKTLSTLHDNQRYSCTLEKIHFFVGREDLIGKDVDPFGPFTMLYDMLARYELRRRGFSEGNSFWDFFRILSGKILNTGYLLLIIILVNIPVIVRLAFFLTYTNPDWYVVNSLKSLGLNAHLLQYSSFGVSVFPRLELYFIYLVLIGLFVLVQFFKIRGTHRVDVVIEILKQCLRDSRKRRIKLAFQTIYKACRSVVKQNSIMGRLRAFVYFILFLPFVVFNFVFYLLPTVNLVCSIPIYLFTYVLSNKCGCLSRSRCVQAKAKKVSDGLGLNPIFINQATGKDLTDGDNEEDSSCFCSPADMLIILILICSLPLLIFVVLDCISFYIDIIIYVLIGLILNASFTTKYVILALMLAFYIRDLFEGVTKNYIKFNDTIINEAMAKTKGDIHKVSLLNENLQKNTVFQLMDETPLAEPDTHKEHVSPTADFNLTYEDGSLSWKTKRLMFFLDRRDTPFIPRKFFSEAIVMDCVGAPGPLDQNLLDVINSILRVFSFLFCIMLIALAFSEDSGSLTANQTLAALAGGLVPWLFRKYLQAPADAGVDVENLHFREVLNDCIREYVESWTVADIEIAKVQLASDQPTAVTDVEGGELRDQSMENLLESESFSAISESVEPVSGAKDEVPGKSSDKKEKGAYEPDTTSVRQNSISDSQDHLIVLVTKKSARAVVV